MLKALLLDMDETLCDTAAANERAKLLMAQAAAAGQKVDGGKLAEAYVAGIYRQWTATQSDRYLAIIEQGSEEEFRRQLIRDLLAQQGRHDVSHTAVDSLQTQFDINRLEAFHFYPGIVSFLAEARELFTLVVITNGPEFSQIPKLEAVAMDKHVDHIIIGGQEPEQKPAASIFLKALKLAGCEAHEAVHVGDSLAADIAGAHGSGITSVWIQHQQPLDAELGINPHHILLHPSEIPALIRGLHKQSS